MTKTKSNYYNGRAFPRFALVTLIAVYLLVVVGGIVRSTGSGMGCPDWPKCFGQWVPPTNVSELPENYKDVYLEKRVSKNVKLASYLDALGLDSKAQQVREDEMILEESDFNVFKTWTEYINRLVGAVIGLLVLGTFLTSIKYFKTRPAIFWVSLAVVLMTGFQGWVGSLVVSTNLLPWMVSVHMLITFFILAGLIYLVYKSRQGEGLVRKSQFTVLLLILGMVTLIVQVIFGTQVREGLDEVALALNYNLRDSWISQLDWEFYFHRSFSWVVFILNGYIAWRLVKAGEKFWSTLLISTIVIAIVSGALMAYLAVPPVLQPLHLVLGCVIFGVQFYLFLIVRNGTKPILV